MRRLAQVIVVLIVAGGIWWFNRPKEQVTKYSATDVWVGDEESGCMYTVAKVTDGKDPVWWSENERKWNQFESKTAAKEAGYRECP